MKKFKKIFMAVVLSIVCAMSIPMFAGCGSNDGGTERTRYFALDKVSLYAVSTEGFSEERVEFNYIKIKESESEICCCDVSGRWMAMGVGACLISNSEIRADFSRPFYFYSERNRANSFAENSELSLSFALCFTCTTGIKSQLTNAVHTISGTTTAKTICVYSDQEHGYDIMALLQFVAI